MTREYFRVQERESCCSVITITSEVVLDVATGGVVIAADPKAAEGLPHAGRGATAGLDAIPVDVGPAAALLVEKGVVVDAALLLIGRATPGRPPLPLTLALALPRPTHGINT